MNKEVCLMQTKATLFCSMKILKNTFIQFTKTVFYARFFLVLDWVGVWTDQTWPDNWTAVTTDGRWSAQFEQTMVVTDTGVEVLTARPGKRHVPYFMEQ